MASRRRQAKKLTKVRAAAVICSECKRYAGLVTGELVYPNRRYLWAKKVWRCCYCPDSYVGCHPGTEVALGTPAGVETRRARRSAHLAFDDLWRRKMERDACEKFEARHAAYQWLADQLGINVQDCHIGAMDIATAMRVVEFCAPYQRRAA